MHALDELADVRPLPEAHPVPWGGLVARLRASELLRRFVPLPVARAAIIAAHRAALARQPEKLAFARATVEAVVGGTAYDGDLDELAFQHLLIWSLGWEWAWRPWLVRKMPVVGLERLAGLDHRRGVIFSRTHMGPPGGVAALARAVGPIDQAVGSYLFEPNPPGYNGYQNEQGRKLMTEAGIVMHNAGGSAAVLTDVLKRGGRVLLHFDVPGSTPVRFLGKTVEMKSGTARLAMDTDAVVVPVSTLPRGRHWTLHVDDPIDPRSFDDSAGLMQAVASVHERLVLAAPYRLESPLRDGGWAEATAAGWRR